MAPGVVSVESHVENRPVKQSETGDDRRVDRPHPKQIGRRDAQDVAEQKAHKVRCVTRGQIYEDDAQSHAERPDQSDGRVFADTLSGGRRLDAQRRGDGEKQRAGDRIGAEVVGHADTSERSVRDAPAQEHQPAAYDVCADKAAGDTAQQTGERCVGEELVLENF